MAREDSRSIRNRMRMSIFRWANRLLVKMWALMPFRLVMVIVRTLLESQGFGAGARVGKSGEIYAARSLLNLKGDSKVVVLDIGANRGEYSELLLNTVPKAEIHAFEPAAKTFKLLDGRLGSRANVSIYNFALGNIDGSAHLYKENPIARIASLTPLDITQDHLTEEIAIRRLDSVFPTLNVEQIHLAKIDVEGHEMDVLMGAEEVIRSGKIKNIQFELGEFSIDTRTTLKSFFTFFGDYQYELFLIRPRSLYPLKQYKPLYEQYSTTNFVACKK